MSRFRCSILVVEDEPQILASMRVLLSRDYELLTAASAEEGQEILRHCDPTSDQMVEIVISDQQLPGVQGIDFLQWVRTYSPRTIRVLTTGSTNLEDAVDAINDGLAHRFLFKPWKPTQLLDIIRSAARSFLLERSHEQLLDRLREINQELEQRVADRTRELEESNRQLQNRNQILQRMALTDSLTEMPNRRAMDQLAKMELVRRSRNPAPLAMALIDADHFKNINTNYLLPGGDHVLRWLGKTLGGSVRTIDAVGRVGGEEFMLVAPDTDMEGAEVLAERVRKAVAEGHTIFNNDIIRITVSIGMVVAEPDVLVDYEQIRFAAAAALSEAKNSGRNCCIVRPLNAFAGPTV